MRQTLNIIGVALIAIAGVAYSQEATLNTPVACSQRSTQPEPRKLDRCCVGPISGF